MATWPKAAKSDKRGARLKPEDRRRDIIDKSVAYFSDVGFDGSTRELARRLNITQPLLYRYFPTKEDLVQEVYDTVYVRRWKPEWITILEDRSRPLRARLEDFYRDYTETVFTREWMRIYFFSGLKGFDITKWYVESVRKRLMTRICHEFRHELGLPASQSIPPEEIELAWTMHGSIFYYGIRQHIYQLDLDVARNVVIANALDVYLAGAAPRVRAIATTGSIETGSAVRRRRPARNLPA